MADILMWPDTLTPLRPSFDPRPFSRGGRSLGGVKRTVRTDRGYWVGSYGGVLFRRATQFDQIRAWTQLRVSLAGTAGLVAVPVCSTRHWAKRPNFTDFSGNLTPHDDGTPFDDETLYSENIIGLLMHSAAAIGDTTVTLRIISAPTVTGIRFSYQHAMYETGRVIEEVTSTAFRVEIFPAIRAPIAAGEELDTDRPTCLCHLATDTEMDIEFPETGMPRPTVNFVEACDYWNDLALA